MNLTVEMGVRQRVSNVTMYVLCDEAETKELPPATETSGMNIVPDKARAFICLIATNYTWREKTVMDPYIVQCDVVHRDDWLSLASTNWIGHASWTIVTSWLFLLLGTDVDTPPDWAVYLNIGVEDVRDLAT